MLQVHYMAIWKYHSEIPQFVQIIYTNKKYQTQKNCYVLQYYQVMEQ
jgi:hypothetical protein